MKPDKKRASDNRQSAVKSNLQLRARIIQAVRGFFYEHDYLEVETPIRLPAPAPEAYIEAEPSGLWYLHTSPEICMKRLLAAGYSRIFQICRCFRQNERGRWHLPEFTLLEWYCAGADYMDLMQQCENLIRFVAASTGCGNSIVYKGQPILLTPPWPRLSVAEAFERFASKTLKEVLREDRFDQIMIHEIEPGLKSSTPVFLYDYPASRSGLARIKPDDPSVAQRFELYMGGLELCNAFSELTDAREQRMRFEKELSDRQRSGQAAYPMPEKFLEALPFMPEAAGNALGLDRLIMLFAGASHIDQVVAFAPEEL